MFVITLTDILGLSILTVTIVSVVVYIIVITLKQRFCKHDVHTNGRTHQEYCIKCGKEF